MKTYIAFGLKKMSDLVWSKSLALSNISFGLLFIVYYSVIGGSTFPLRMMLPQFNIAYLVGGYMGSVALNEVAG